MSAVPNNPRDNSYKRTVHNHYQGLHTPIVYDSTPHGPQHQQTWTTMPLVNGQPVLASRVAGNTRKEAEEGAAMQVWNTVINA
ncbi:hypothetical protein EYR40_001193 [Pleurotus pulmonarius]|nr:hypothetical protein EYR36_000464 [Pleurotus pulmonarius]KAF4604009.1 hypothetical protein EYR38_004431 [Pleurotus pulmonarius]KAF4608840.1 hypothetical protein EYR40_001193 [Pleurotus pulmonarius]